MWEMMILGSYLERFFFSRKVLYQRFHDNILQDPKSIYFISHMTLLTHHYRCLLFELLPWIG